MIQSVVMACTVVPFVQKTDSLGPLQEESLLNIQPGHEDFKISTVRSAGVEKRKGFHESIEYTCESRDPEDNTDSLCHCAQMVLMRTLAMAYGNWSLMTEVKLDKARLEPSTALRWIRDKRQDHGRPIQELLITAWYISV